MTVIVDVRHCPGCEVAGPDPACWHCDGPTLPGRMPYTAQITAVGSTEWGTR